MKSQSGNLVYRNYSGYRYNFKQNALKAQKKSKKSRKKTYLSVLIIAALVVGGYFYFHSKNQSSAASKTPSVAIKTAPPSLTPQSNASTVQTLTSACNGNDLSQLIVTSISQRHLWACNMGQVVYQTPVVTGDMYVAADVTPLGTYHIYSKQTDQFLTGHDSRGSWDDFVNYWMPFLTNGYGTFGLHDATWRSPSDFGNISPYSDQASHGCIELPLSAAQWLFNWSNIGTTVKIES